MSRHCIETTLVLACVLAVWPGNVEARGKPEPTRDYTTTVSRVIDGDTIVVDDGNNGLHVRLRCVDSPEIAHGAQRTQPYGREAAQLTRSALSGQRVRLVYHTREPLDRYNRLLAYVFLENGTLFNAELVRLGYARTTRFKCLYRDQVKALESEARRQHRGLWGARR